MRYATALMAAIAVSLVAAPIVAHAEDEHEGRGGHEGWRGGGEGWRGGDDGESGRQERHEERREDRREDGGWNYGYSYGYPSYNSYSYGYTSPYYGSTYGYQTYPRCHIVLRRSYDAYGDLVSRRVRICR